MAERGTMPAMLTLPALLMLASAAAAPGSIRLQALTATSGTGVERVLDGDPRTGWTPDGDPRDEGVLFRFEAPVQVMGLELTSCGGPIRVTPFLDGYVPEESEFEKVEESVTRFYWGDSTGIRSVFLRVEAGPFCLSEVAFLDGERRLPVLPPRQLRGRVTATSTLSPAQAYHPSYLFDGRLDFGWAEGAAGSGVGEGLTIELDQAAPITSLELWNGYQRSDAHYTRNVRARGLTVALDDRPPVAFELRDERASQKLALPSGPPARRITLRVTSVYPGLKYPDLVLSELRLWDAEGPLTLATPDREELKRALLEQARPTVLAGLLGKRLEAWETRTQPTQTLKLRADHTLVSYQSCSSRARCISEAMDGTWVLVGTDGPWAEIEVFARTHRTDSNLDPYSPGGAFVKESTRIAGGKLRITRVSAPTPDAPVSEPAGPDRVIVKGTLLDRELHTSP